MPTTTIRNSRVTTTTSPKNPQTGDTDDEDDDSNNGGNGRGLPPLPGIDNNDDGIPDPWPMPDGPRNPAGSPCSGCVQMFPFRPGNGTTSPKVTKSPPNIALAALRVATDDGQEVTIGGMSASGRPAMSTSESGGLMVGADGIVPISLSGLTPGSTITVWLADQFSVSGTVLPDGTVVLSAPVQKGLPSGVYTGRIDITDSFGNPQSILFGFEWQSSASSIFGLDGKLANALGVIALIIGSGVIATAVLRRRSVKRKVTQQ
ncbi:MAG: hypothetical protein ACO3QU_07890 [Ilumatobacteraceae bacterium]